MNFKYLKYWIDLKPNEIKKIEPKELRDECYKEWRIFFTKILGPLVIKLNKTKFEFSSDNLTNKEIYKEIKEALNKLGLKRPQMIEIIKGKTK